jgi:hypothetical protein
MMQKCCTEDCWLVHKVPERNNESTGDKRSDNQLAWDERDLCRPQQRFFVSSLMIRWQCDVRKEACLSMFVVDCFLKIELNE